MVLVKTDVTFQGYEQKIISKGDKAGQTFYIVKLLSGFDTLEVMIFNDNADLLASVFKAVPFNRYNAEIGINQTSGNTKLSLINLVSIKQ